MNRKSEVLKDSGKGHDQQKTMKDEYKIFATPRIPSIPRYQNTFLGICYSCNNFGHKAIDCRSYDKVVHMRRRGFQNVQCYTCHNYGHISRNCLSHKVRFYNQRPNLVWKREEQTQDRNENPFSSLSKYHEECSKCNNYGHTANNCQISSDKSNKGHAEECGLALYAQNARDQWYLDCVFSKHITGGQNKFIMLKNDKEKV